MKRKWTFEEDDIDFPLKVKAKNYTFPYVEIPLKKNIFFFKEKCLLFARVAFAW